ncbi:MAG TPA: nucleotidyltransferase domain-containing protein [Clostridium sp.]|nr:nucleotidyltransferase domain-containing protein [Clostridium sp.]
MDVQKRLETVVKTIDKLVSLKEVYLFGSYAYGSPNEHSDFDLYIVVDKINGRKHDVLVKLYSAIRGISIW